MRMKKRGHTRKIPERFDLMEKYTAHNPIEDGDTVFFATYRVGVGVGEKIYADFIEPYFQDPADLVAK